MESCRIQKQRVPPRPSFVALSNPNMHSKIWLACIVLSSPTRAATLPKASGSDHDPKSSPLELLSVGNVSIAKTDASSLNDSSVVNPLSLDGASPLLSNYSSLYDQSFGSEVTTVPDSGPICNGGTYGVHLDVLSCFDAWQNVGLSPEVISWGPRGPGDVFQYKLPVRFSSGEIATKCWERNVGVTYR